MTYYNVTGRGPSHCRKTCTENLLNFGRVVREICWRTDATPISGRSNHNNIEERHDTGLAVVVMSVLEKVYSLSLTTVAS